LEECKHGVVVEGGLLLIAIRSNLIIVSPRIVQRLFKHWSSKSNQYNSFHLNKRIHWLCCFIFTTIPGLSQYFPPALDAIEKLLLSAPHAEIIFAELMIILPSIPTTINTNHLILIVNITPSILA